MKSAAAALLLALATLAPAPAAAGPFNDALAVCLVKSTSEQDKTLLVRWFFAAMSRHPQVSDLSRVTPAQGAQLNADVAALMWALVSDRCVGETREAVKFEGPAALSASFEVLGKVAAQGLMADATVNAYIGDMAKNLDEGKLKALFEVPAGEARSEPPAKP